MKIISWNINKKELQNEILDLVQAELPDILVLCECTINATKLLEKLNAVKILYHYIDTKAKNIKIFTLFSSKFVTPLEERNKYSILKISLPLTEEFLLVPLHFPDKSSWSEASQKYECIAIAKSISNAETKSNINQTIVAGDFNMNPFEEGIVSSMGFHAIRDKKIALKKTRIVNGISYKFFFNPMWRFYGEKSNVRGTYSYWSSEHVCHFWNIFDQIIFRPELISKFEEDNLKIILKIKQHNLIDGRGEISKGYSDHLPVKAIFNL